MKSFQVNRNKTTMNKYHHYHNQITEKFNVIEYIEGHYYKTGKDANIMKNPIWSVKENGKEYLLMYCEKDTIVKLCHNSYNAILEYEKNENDGKKITWYKHQNGYVLCHKKLYIHQIITRCYGNGQGTKNISVDHIDRDTLNNTFDNLRIATREIQEQNSKGIMPGTKRERNYNAKDLPKGIEQHMMKKYVVYYHEWLDKEHTKPREYFKIEKHPKLDKPWISTKSGKVSIMEKLQQANKVVDDLEKDVYPDDNQSALPKYVSLVVAREKPHLVFEKRTQDKRMGIRMVLPEEYDLQEQLIILNEKIKEKYEGQSVL